MTSDHDYPDFMKDAFGALIHSYRCTAELKGSRCQLSAGHATQRTHMRLCCSRRVGLSPGNHGSSDGPTTATLSCTITGSD